MCIKPTGGQELSNGVNILALRPTVEEISMPERRVFTTDSILADVKVDFMTYDSDSWRPKRAKILYTQEHCKTVIWGQNGRIWLMINMWCAAEEFRYTWTIL